MHPIAGCTKLWYIIIDSDTIAVHLLSLIHIYGKRCAFRGIGARSQLVEQTQRIRVRMGQDMDNAGHMGGEGGKTLLYALLIPYIRINLSKNGQFRTVKMCIRDRSLWIWRSIGF